MRSILFFLLAFGLAGLASAHEVRPAYLEIAETEPEVFQVSWKQPVTDGRRLVLNPILPEVCTSLDEPEARIVESAVVTRWRVACDMKTGLISIDGLDRTLTDVFIQVSYLEDEIRRAVIRPGEVGLELSKAEGGAASSYLRLGVEHILSGPDHLLFVLGLLLLAPLRKLVLVITAFTLAHSLTLGLTSVGLVSLSPGPVETMIAVSILLLAVEAVYALDGGSSLAARWPWLISFGFGLLHGFGFAGALGEIGLPPGAELSALFYFNVGVEIGQLMFIGVLLGLTYLFTLFAKAKLPSLQRFAAYVVGVSGAFWVFERLGTLFTV